MRLNRQRQRATAAISAPVNAAEKSKLRHLNQKRHFPNGALIVVCEKRQRQ
jgi:hypothetical protein